MELESWIFLYCNVGSNINQLHDLESAINLCEFYIPNLQMITVLRYHPSMIMEKIKSNIKCTGLKCFLET